MITMFILLYCYFVIAVIVGLGVYIRNKNPEQLSKTNLRRIDLCVIAIFVAILWPLLTLTYIRKMC
jgi:hypothetical protein